jgi:hypothetical protein
MAATWVTEDDIKSFLGIPTLDTLDDDWLTQATAAANDYAFRKRANAAYVDEEATVPSQDVKTGTILYAAAIFRERGSVENFTTFEDFQSSVVAGGQAQINRLLGVPRPVAY